MSERDQRCSRLDDRHVQFAQQSQLERVAGDEGESVISHSVHDSFDGFKLEAASKHDVRVLDRFGRVAGFANCKTTSDGELRMFVAWVRRPPPATTLVRPSCGRARSSCGRGRPAARRRQTTSSSSSDPPGLAVRAFGALSQPLLHWRSFSRPLRGVA